MQILEQCCIKIGARFFRATLYFSVKINVYDVTLRESIYYLWPSLGTTSKFDGNSLSLQCKDRASDPLPPSIFTAEFPSDLIWRIPYMTQVMFKIYISRYYSLEIGTLNIKKYCSLDKKKAKSLLEDGISDFNRDYSEPI